MTHYDTLWHVMTHQQINKTLYASYKHAVIFFDKHHRCYFKMSRVCRLCIVNLKERSFWCEAEACIYRIGHLLDVPEPCASDSFPSIICRAEKALENNILVVLRCARMEHAKEPIVAQVRRPWWIVRVIPKFVVEVCKQICTVMCQEIGNTQGH